MSIIISVNVITLYFINHIRTIKENIWCSSLFGLIGICCLILSNSVICPLADKGGFLNSNTVLLLSNPLPFFLSFGISTTNSSSFSSSLNVGNALVVLLRNVFLHIGQVHLNLLADANTLQEEFVSDFVVLFLLLEDLKCLLS